MKITTMIKKIWILKAVLMGILLMMGMPFAQGQIERVEPPHWWTGMSNSRLQLLVKGANIADYTPRIEVNGIELEGVSPGDSKNYLFLDLNLTAANPGVFKILFEKEGAATISTNYTLFQREINGEELEGFNSSDVIYLITPDRFANGDPSNDQSDELREAKLNRKDDYARHGGDIQGIINHLDYLQGMGFTAVWPSPLLENNMPTQSYHGYAITDYYKVDPRFGTLETYKELAQLMREQGMKLIFDGVVNHCGSMHWWMSDMPFKDWVNFPDVEGTITTNHRRTVNQDPYAAQSDKDIMSGGWFVPAMPDLNQRNPFMATYLIQNSIWWIETLKLGGIRQDTYPYPDKNFLSDWTCAIMDEYPNFSLVGEEWSYNPLLVAYWQEGNENKDGYTSCLKSTMDFPMQANLSAALTEEEGWATGLVKLYEGLANDFAYVRPNDILTFGDNHDMDRLHTQMKDDPALTKMAVAYLLTTRGIPQIYYGTEVLIQNTKKRGDHGLIRTDFPGGWDKDKVDAFSGIGLSSEQEDMMAYMKKILEWRQGNEVISSGKTLHFAPEKGVYVYFRYNDDQKVMVIMNKNESETNLELKRFSEILSDGANARNVLTDDMVGLGETMKLAPKTTTILELD